jgi:hypothetical protein
MKSEREERRTQKVNPKLLGVQHVAWMNSPRTFQDPEMNRKASFLFYIMYFSLKTYVFAIGFLKVPMTSRKIISREIVGMIQ